VFRCFGGVDKRVSCEKDGWTNLSDLYVAWRDFAQGVACWSSRWLHLCNTADHIYIVPSCFFFLLLFLFPRLISAVGDWMSTIYFHTWCGLSANLECRSEMCCTLLAENTGRKKVAKNRHLGTIAKFCRAISSQLRHLSTIGKKLVKHQYVLHRSS